MRGLVYLCLFLSFSQVIAYGQRRRTSKKEIKRFEAGVLLGVNFSQIDGDYFTGFDKKGIYGGIRGVANVSNTTSIVVDMLYSQKGSKIPHGVVIDNQSVNDRIIGINYAEVPIVLKHKLLTTSSSPFLELGLSFSRQINTIIQEKSPGLFKGTVYREIESQFERTDMNLVAGLGAAAGSHLSIGLRYNFSLNRFYFNEAYEAPTVFSLRPREVQFLRNYYISFYAAYHIL